MNVSLGVCSPIDRRCRCRGFKSVGKLRETKKQSPIRGSYCFVLLAAFSSKVTRQIRGSTANPTAPFLNEIHPVTCFTFVLQKFISQLRNLFLRYKNGIEQTDKW